MLSENEKDARRKFFEATGKTPEQEGRDSVHGLGLLFWICVALAGGAGLFYLLG